MRILITGISGFAGSHLANALLRDSNVTLFGLARKPLSLPDWEQRVHLRALDLCDTDELLNLLREIRPEQIYHLAGSANVSQSFEDPQQTWRINVEGTRSLYDAVVRLGGSPRILYVGSGLGYAEPKSDGEAVDEDTPFAPANPYALSKATADLLSYQYHCWPGLDVVRARPFNHIGPRQSPQFALPSFARQLVQMELGIVPPTLQTGNLDAYRDFTDVRDIVRGYMLLMARGISGEAYNLASGNVVSIREVVNVLLERVEFPVTLVQKDHLKRASEARITRANINKICRSLGWEAVIPLRQTLQDVLDSWRETLGNTAGTPVLENTIS